MPRTAEILARQRFLPQPFACTAMHGGLDTAWVHVVGELDIATVPELARTLRESQQRARLVVLDLRELSFIDCSGVHAIVNASLRARAAERKLVLVRGCPDVYRLFRLTESFDDVDLGDSERVPSR
jgi:anti-sigma B factor antagonist